MALAATLLAPLSAQAQAPATLELAAPDGVLEADPLDRAGFSIIRAVRELPDGRVLVADWGENRLAVVDMDAGETLAELLRTGEGPGEFNRIGRLYALAGDSTLVTDAFSRRWFVFRGTDPVRTIAATERLPYWFGPRPYGVDDGGRVLGMRQHPVDGVWRSRADTLVLLLGHLDRPGIDTIARLRGPGRYEEVEVPVGDRMDDIHHPLRSEEQAQLFPDGWIAVARHDPYRVDWRSPDGRWTRGEPLETASIPVDQDEKCLATRRMLQGRAGCEVADYFEWPEALPPFILYDIGAHTARGTPILHADPRGRLLVRRTESARFPGTRYDLIDRRGQRIGVLTLPGNEAIVGFGPESVYTIRRDDLDLQTLRRHPWP